MKGVVPTQGGIIAAGAGSRLRQAGWTVPKPLLQVAGTTLIERIIRNFLAAGIRSIVIIFNEDDRDCESWVRSQFGRLDLQVIVRTTASSWESFRAVCERFGEGPAVISTVDAWCGERDFVDFLTAARQCPSEALVLAVTPLVADERPLWVSLDETGRIRALGDEPADMVTAGIYILPESVRHLSVPSGLGRLREFLAWVVASGMPAYGVPIEAVVDVDRAEDVAIAEDLARRWGMEAVKPLGDVT